MNEYRFEDLYIGKEECFSVTVTEEMMKMFLELSGDSNPLHNDEDFAISQGYQNKVVYGLLTTSFISRLVGVLLPGEYCLLQGIEVKYSKPVYVGDILIVNIENEFGMMFDMAEVSDLANVGEMADLILKKAAEEE